MLFNIVLKNFKYNLNNYIPFFLSEMMAITMLFSFLALKHSLSTGIYGNTILLSMVVLIGAVFSVMIMMGDKNVSKLAEDKQKKEIRPKGKKWLLLVFAGIGFYVFGIYLYQKDVSKGSYRSMMIWTIAAFLILYFGLGLILEIMKNREKFYFRNILHLNQLYHQYSTNYLVMYALTLIHFFAIGYLAIQIAGALPLAPEKIGYPYDVAWCTSENAQGFVDELETKYDASVNAYPMFAATGRNLLQQIAISADTYEALTGKTVSLKRDERVFSNDYAPKTK